VCGYSLGGRTFERQNNMEQLQAVEISKCYESPTNPRGTVFEAAPQKELQASIREKGVLVPILVRQVKDRYEVIAGNRRLRAAKAEGLMEIPARIVVMSDTEVREAQIVENLQRADVHALEEGKAYRDLIERSSPRYEVADVAAKVGKSENFVRDRLVLTNLIPAGQKAFRAGIIHIGHAALIARLDAKVQKEALEQCESGVNTLTDEWHGGPTNTSVARLRRWIQERSWQDIAAAPWKDDEQLQAVYKGCDECKGKGGDLFGKKAAEACTNPKCYVQRAIAYIELKRKEMPELALISNEYGKAEPYGPEKIQVRCKSEYEELQRGDKSKCTGATQAIVVSGQGMGHIKTVCWAEDCPVHKRTYRTSYSQTPEEKAKAKEARRKEIDSANKKREKDHSSTKEAVDRMSWPLSDKHLAALLSLATYHASHDVLQGVCKRRELEAEKHTHHHGRDYRGAVEKAAKSMKAKERAGLLFELLLPSYSPNHDGRTKWLKSI